MKKSTSTKGRSVSKSTAKKGGTLGKSKAASTKSRPKPHAAMQRGASATAPVVYQTIRERVEAVDSNIGTTQTLSDFLKSSGW
jgi:hypothetical protein